MKKQSELKDIVERLEGYDEKNWYEIVNAEKKGFVWILTVRHRVEEVPAEEEPTEAEMQGAQDEDKQ